MNYEVQIISKGEWSVLSVWELPPSMLSEFLSYLSPDGPVPYIRVVRSKKKSAEFRFLGGNRWEPACNPMRTK